MIWNVHGTFFTSTKFPFPIYAGTVSLLGTILFSLHSAVKHYILHIFFQCRKWPNSPIFGSCTSQFSNLRMIGFHIESSSVRCQMSIVCWRHCIRNVHLFSVTGTYLLLNQLIENPLMHTIYESVKLVKQKFQCLFMFSKNKIITYRNRPRTSCIAATKTKTLGNWLWNVKNRADKFKIINRESIYV